MQHELVVVRRSRRARRWTIDVPWGSPARLTAPVWMSDAEIDRAAADLVRGHRPSQSVIAAGVFPEAVRNDQPDPRTVDHPDSGVQPESVVRGE